MYTDRTNYLFYSADVPQKEVEDPKARTFMLVMGIIYIAVFLLSCFVI